MTLRLLNFVAAAGADYYVGSVKRPTPGRPPLDDGDESRTLHLTLTASQYDHVFERAARERITVPEAIRRAVTAAEKDLR